MEEHLDLIEKVLRVLQAHGVKVKMGKCCWVQKRVRFLGHMISENGLSKLDTYVAQVDNFKKPSTVKELRSFLGLVNFQRKFVPRCSVLMKPLSVWTGGRSTKIIKWSPEMDAAFVTLKEELRRDMCLAYPDYKEGACPLELYTDASASGVGACLCQTQDGQFRRISYASIAFTSTQKNYSTLEKELAAIRWALKVFRPFLLGVQFEVYTDHQPLQYLNNMALASGRLARTLEDLSDFSFVIRYTPGARNTAADYLSRIHPMPDDAIRVDVGKLPEGLKCYTPAPGGGDSLVFSLHHVINVNLTSPAGDFPITFDDLRRWLVKELLRVPGDYFRKSSRTLTTELRVMEAPGQLMCVEALAAFARLFSCVVLLHYGGDTPVVHSAPGVRELRGLPIVHLQCLAGVHYNPVAVVGSYTPPAILGAAPDAGIADVSPEFDPNVTEDEEDHRLGCLLEEPPGCQWHVKRTNLPCVMMGCQGQMFCSLLDTGAQVSCVSRQVVDELKMTWRDHPRMTIRGLGQGSSLVLGSVDLAVEFEKGSVFTHTFMVLDSTKMPFCFICGMDFFIERSAVIDFRSGHCKMGGVSVEFPVLRSDYKSCEELNDSREDRLVNLVVSEVGSLFSGDEIQSTCEEEDFDMVTVMLNGEDGETVTVMVSEDEVRHLQSKDKVIRKLSRIVRGDTCIWSDDVGKYRRHAQSLEDYRGLLVRRRAGRLTYVVPKNVLIELALGFHFDGAHMGREKLLEALTNHVWHPDVSHVVADITRSCDHCQRTKVASVVHPPVLKVASSAPFELVCVDLLALPTTRRGHVACFVLTDHYSKWLSVVPLRSKTATAVVNALTFALSGLPRLPGKILSDNGPEFRSSLFTQRVVAFGVEHCFTTPYRPQSNGLVERCNRSLTELLRSLQASPSAWDDDLPRAVITFNATLHSELGMSPSQFLLERSHNVVPAPPIPYTERELWKGGNPSFSSFVVGEKVMKKVIFRDRLLTHKFRHRWEGPFNIQRVNENGITYIIRDASGRDVRVHHAQLKRYHVVPSYLARHPGYVRRCGRESDSGVAGDVPSNDDESTRQIVSLPARDSLGDFGSEEEERNVTLPPTLGLGNGWSDVSGSLTSLGSSFSGFDLLDRGGDVETEREVSRCSKLAHPTADFQGGSQGKAGFGKDLRCDHLPVPVVCWTAAEYRRIYLAMTNTDVFTELESDQYQESMSEAQGKSQRDSWGEKSLVDSVEPAHLVASEVHTLSGSVASVSGSDLFVGPGDRGGERSGKELIGSVLDWSVSPVHMEEEITPSKDGVDFGRCVRNIHQQLVELQMVFGDKELLGRDVSWDSPPVSISTLMHVLERAGLGESVTPPVDLTTWETRSMSLTGDLSVSRSPDEVVGCKRRRRKLRTRTKIRQPVLRRSRRIQQRALNRTMVDCEEESCDVEVGWETVSSEREVELSMESTEDNLSEDTSYTETDVGGSMGQCSGSVVLVENPALGETRGQEWTTGGDSRDSMASGPGGILPSSTTHAVFDDGVADIYRQLAHLPEAREEKSFHGYPGDWSPISTETLASVCLWTGLRSESASSVGKRKRLTRSVGDCPSVTVDCGGTTESDPRSHSCPDDGRGKICRIQNLLIRTKGKYRPQTRRIDPLISTDGRSLDGSRGDSLVGRDTDEGSSISGFSRVLREVPERPHTRAKGPVKEHPHVMEKPLEYKK